MHPLYDPETQTWIGYHNGNCYEVRTLADLAGRLPGVVIEGYYPDGYGPVKHTSALDSGDLRATKRKPVVRDPREARRKAAQALSDYQATQAAHLAIGSPVPSDAPLRLKYSEQENRALDLWLEGYSATEIGARVGRKTTWVASWVVVKARALADPRAVVRYPNLTGPRQAKQPRTGSGHLPAG